MKRYGIAAFVTVAIAAELICTGLVFGVSSVRFIVNAVGVGIYLLLGGFLLWRGRKQEIIIDSVPDDVDDEVEQSEYRFDARTAYRNRATFPEPRPYHYDQSSSPLTTAILSVPVANDDDDEYDDCYDDSSSGSIFPSIGNDSMGSDSTGGFDGGGGGESGGGGASGSWD